MQPQPHGFRHCSWMICSVLVALQLLTGNTALGQTAHVDSDQPLWSLRRLRAASGTTSSSSSTSSATLEGSHGAMNSTYTRSQDDKLSMGANQSHHFVNNIFEPWIAPPTDGMDEAFALVMNENAFDAFTTQQPFSGCVGALVSKRHLLLDAACVREEIPAPTTDMAKSSASLTWAFFHNHSIEVQSIVPIGATGSLAVVLLGEEVEESLARPFRVSSDLAFNELVSTVQVVDFDEVLTRKANKRRVLSSVWIPPARVCRRGEGDARYCFAFGAINDRRLVSSVASAFLVSNNEHCLGGIVSKSLQPTSNDSRLSEGLFPFVNLGDDLQDQLNAATNNSLTWWASFDMYPNYLDLPSSPFQHLAQLQFASPRPWADSCQAVLIAASFVLTSSFCFDEMNPVTSVIVGSSEGEKETIPVKKATVEGPALLLELSFPSFFLPVTLMASFAEDTGEADPVLVHSGMNAATGFEVVSERMHLMTNESGCGGSRFMQHKKENSKTVRCVTSIRVFQGLEPSITPRPGDVFQYNRNNVAVLFGFATGEPFEDAGDISFHRVDLLRSFLDTHAHGLRWISMDELIDVSPDNTPSYFGGMRASADLAFPFVDADDGPVPFLVALMETSNGQKFCEGTLISLMHVLTAAHCVQGGNAKWVAVHSNNPRSPEVIHVAEDKTKIHPSFGSPYKTSYDVAILELEYASAVGKPIVLDNSEDFGNDVVGTAYVYELPKEHGNPDTVLEIELPMWSKKKCTTKWPSIIDDSMVCAGGRAGQDTCQGDSGGPLVVSDETNQMYLAGLVSGGYKCGVEGNPGIYARVAEVAAFIDAHVGVDHRWRFRRNKPSSGDHLEDTGTASSPETPSTSSSPPSFRPNVQPSITSRPTSSRGPEFKSDDTTTADSSSHSLTPSAQSNASVVSLTLPTSLPVAIRRAVTDFVFGEHDDAWVRMFPTGMWDALHSNDRTLVFLSSASLAGIEQVIERFKQRAVASGRASRTNRFESSTKNPSSSMCLRGQQQ